MSDLKVGRIEYDPSFGLRTERDISVGDLPGFKEWQARVLKKPPLDLGTVVEPYGKLAAVALITGERVYFFVDKHGTVSMMPATSIDAP